MVWVLWDILIPLLASFALGTLFGWLVWNRWPKTNQVTQSAATSDSPATTENQLNKSVDMSVASGSDADSQMEVRDAVAVAEMEKANVVLISERDKAAQALEELQIEADAMREKIAELETAAEDATSVSPTAVEASQVTNHSVPLTADLSRDNKDKQELELLKADLQQLSETLGRERKSRRATELELLNIKNRHDKLSGDLASTVSVAEHEKKINDRDEKIKLLKEQLSTKSERMKNDVEVQNTEVPEGRKTEDQKSEVSKKIHEGSAVKTTLVVKPATVAHSNSTASTPDSGEPVSVAAAAGIETVKVATPDKPAVMQNKKPLKNGYVPQGWSVPESKPTKKERDKLTNIKGVGPVLEKILHDCGIYYYQQVASLDKSGMEELQQQIPQFPGRIQRDKWVEQAKKLQRQKESA